MIPVKRVLLGSAGIFAGSAQAADLPKEGRASRIFRAPRPCETSEKSRQLRLPCRGE
jgi:hypothetical protein